MSKALIHIVDDDPLYGKAIKKILQVNKYDNVVLFQSGEACLEALDKKPKLIILDFSLETLNGLDVLRLIKKGHSSAKVVFLTSIDENKELRERCEKEGALGFFHKDEKGTKMLLTWIKKNVRSGFFSFFN
ncbi:MAG: response regulator [Cyclobacteriaceae bacterium]|nr:response regulator [Cyclobacteriaceae bacterium]